MVFDSIQYYLSALFPFVDGIGASTNRISLRPVFTFLFHNLFANHLSTKTAIGQIEACPPDVKLSKRESDGPVIKCDDFLFTYQVRPEATTIGDTDRVPSGVGIVIRVGNIMSGKNAEVTMSTTLPGNPFFDGDVDMTQIFSEIPRFGQLESLPVAVEIIYE